MSAELQFLHRTWVVDDLEQLPDDGYRYEIVDGQLVVTPPPRGGHQITADYLRDLFVRRGLFAHTGMGLRLDVSGSYVIPDVVVLDQRASLVDDYLEPTAVLVVVEVLSRSTARRDRRVKTDLYAEAGIPTYVIVDWVERTWTHLVLRDGQYVESDEPCHGVTAAELAVEAGWGS